MNCVRLFENSARQKSIFSIVLIYSLKDTQRSQLATLSKLEVFIKSTFELLHLL